MHGYYGDVIDVRRVFELESAVQEVDEVESAHVDPPDALGVDLAVQHGDHVDGVEAAGDDESVRRLRDLLAVTILVQSKKRVDAEADLRD